MERFRSVVVVKFMREIYDGVRTFMIGMKVTGVHLKENLGPNPKNAVTVPFDGTVAETAKVAVDVRFRGNLVLDQEKCGGCKQCLRVCPVDCFWIETEKTETGKQRVSKFDFDLMRCMYCGLCVQACATKCLTFSKDWTGSASTSNPVEPGEDPGNCLLRHYGKGFLTFEEKIEVESKRMAADEARKKAAAEAAAKKVTEAAAKPVDPKDSPPAAS
jgi:formate hydrogenlyase subunit 6/NADH:ubiquinone oxidoreductase subunit I